MSATRTKLSDRIIAALNLQRFFHGEGPSNQPVTLNSRRVYILPTREGYIFALVLMAMLLAAINYRNALLYMLTFLLTGLGIVTMLHTWRNLVGLNFRAGRVSPVFAGDTARFQIQLNNSHERPRLNLHMVPNDHGEGVSKLSIDQPGNHTQLVDLPCPATRRGLLNLGRFTVSSRFPLGLFRAWSFLDLDMQALIYPRPGKPIPMPPPEPGKTKHNAQRAQGMDDFHSLREYVPQDSPRHVHWKAVARGQGMLTKEFTGEGASERWLNWDSLGNMGDESRLSQLCRWVLDADQAGEAYGLRLPGIEIAPDSGEAHLYKCLQALALFRLGQP